MTAISSVYLHVPFCARRCRYCDFAIEIDRKPVLKNWTDPVGKEWQAALADPALRISSPLETLYVGGGTPSLLGPELASTVVGIIGSERIPKDGEWTVEVNPESFSTETAESWRRAGVNRVSIGIQSFHEPTLRWMARLHRPEGATKAVENARRAGFTEISVDLIFGLPEHLGRSWTHDLDLVLRLGVPHISLYGLTVEAGTPLAKAIHTGREADVSHDRYEAEYLEAAVRLREAGYDHYEVSNFARPGHRARHNSVYWSRTPYLGLGNGAHSFTPPHRRWNVKSWPEYGRRMAEGVSPVDDGEAVEGPTKLLERVWLALRTSEGLDLMRLVPRLSEARKAQVGELLSGWTRQGLTEEGARRIRLTAAGWLVLDRLSVELSDCLAAP